jgi:hypothetical protein
LPPFLMFRGQHEHATLEVKMHVGDRKVSRFDDLPERDIFAVARAGKDRAAVLLDEEFPLAETVAARRLSRLGAAESR